MFGTSDLLSTSTRLPGPIFMTPLFRVLETMHTGFVLRILYYIVIISFGDGEKLAKIDWSLLVSLCTSTSSVCHVLTVCIILSKAIAVAEVRNETTFSLSL